MKSPLVALSMIVLSHGPVLAADPTRCRAANLGTMGEWQCFGAIDLAIRQPGKPDASASFIHFDNGESQFEQQLGTKAKTMLTGRKFTAYRGLDALDSVKSQRGPHPFRFFEYATLPGMAVLIATDKRPSELPLGESLVNRAVSPDDKGLLQRMQVASIQGRVRRKDNNQIEFDGTLRLRSAPGYPHMEMEVTGTWAPESRPAQADSMAMTGWQYACAGSAAKDLELHYDFAADATLGDLRRQPETLCR